MTPPSSPWCALTPTDSSFYPATNSSGDKHSTVGENEKHPPTPTLVLRESAYLYFNIFTNCQIPNSHSNSRFSGIYTLHTMA